MLTIRQKEQIIEFRKLKQSYGQIAEALNINYDQVKSFTHTKSFRDKHPELIGSVNNVQQGNKLTANNIVEIFKEKYPDFQYVSGYVNCESRIKIRCGKCGDVFERNAQKLRKNKELGCSNCVVMKDKDIKEKRLMASEQREADGEQLKIDKRITHIKSITKVKKCKQCGNEYISTKRAEGYCSVRCSKRYNNNAHEISRRHRLRGNGKVDYTVTLDKLIKKDKGMCRICREKIDTNDFTMIDGTFIARGKYPSIDHINPVSKGGTHTWGNIQLAHVYCNIIKRDNAFYVSESGQLSMSM